MWATACLFTSLFPFVIIMTTCSFGLDEKRRVWESYGATICTCGDFQTPAPCTKSDNSLVCRKKRNVTYYMFYRHRYKIMCLSTLKNYMSSLFRQWNNVFYVEGILENHIQFYFTFAAMETLRSEVDESEQFWFQYSGCKSEILWVMINPPVCLVKSPSKFIDFERTLAHELTLLFFE